MASSSATNSERIQWKYDVFLSFRGLDTRNNFTGHLFEGLTNRGIHTFMDKRELEHGSSISEELLKAIEVSQFAIVIFSENYATSSWCLDEVVKIMNCKIQYEQMVLPVFYNVDPSTVRYQTKSFADSFEKHESRYKDDDEGMQKIKRWRTALTAVANLSGHDIRDKSESDSIKQIVEEISSKKLQTPLPYLQDLVGIEAHLKEVKSLLKIDEIKDPLIMGIWGIGGVGKTTIARAIFDSLFSQFKTACFLADVKQNKDGIHSLQNILLEELLGEKVHRVNNKEDGKNLISRRLCKMKVLLVLDDIAHKDHLDYLAGDLRWFGNGSRIITTTRDKHLMGKDIVYEVKELVGHEAIQLFKKHAFKEEVPDERFDELTFEVVSHAKGLPLALKVWGAFLHNRDIEEWKSATVDIKNNSDSEVIDKLKISYDGLTPTQQHIFLDIACFHRGNYKKYVVQMLEGCDFRALIGLRVLIDKSLVFISKDDRVEMHDLIQDMGRYVVKMQMDAGECSRVWLAEDLEVLMNYTDGTKAVEAIVLEDPPEQLFLQEALKNMKRLRMLHRIQIDFSINGEKAPLIKRGSIEYLPNSLRCFVWEGYPWKSLPANFEPKRLIHLKLWKSSLCHLWTKAKDLRCLRTLDLSYTWRLKQTPDFTRMPNLEYVDLAFCTSLEEVHSSLGNCNKLIHLCLNGCRSLKRFPRVNVESLEFLDLRNCSSLEIFPEIVGKMKLELEIFKYTGGTRIREVPSSIQYQTHLTKLNLSQQYSKLSPGFASLPKGIGYLVNLEWLDARNTLISQPPSSIVQLNKLKFLSFAKDKLEFYTNYFVFPPVAEGLQSLEELNLSYCNLMWGGLPQDFGCLSSLKELELCYCNLTDEGLPKDFGCLSSLKMLNLSGNNFYHLPQSIGQLGALKCLNLSCCNRLKEMPDFTGMPNLEYVDLSSCTSLEEIHHSVGYLKNLSRLNLYYCTSLKRCPALWINSLKFLNLRECSSLENFPEILPGSMKMDSEILMLDRVMRDTSHSFRDTLIQNRCSDSLSQRVFTIQKFDGKIPSWFHHQGKVESVSVNLPENWYDCDKFLGVAVCYSGSKLVKTTAELVPLCDDGRTHKLALCNHSEFAATYGVHFFLVSIADLWDTSEASGKTPNDYGLLRLSFSEMEFGFRLLYKDEPGCEPSLLMQENNDEPTENCDGLRRSTYDNNEQHDSVSVTNDASCSSSEIQSSHSNIPGGSVFENLQQQVDSVTSEANCSYSKKRGSQSNIQGRVARLFNKF